MPVLVGSQAIPGVRTGAYGMNVSSLPVLNRDAALLTRSFQEGSFAVKIRGGRWCR
jgi:hypothetical protein